MFEEFKKNIVELGIVCTVQHNDLLEYLNLQIHGLVYLDLQIQGLHVSTLH
jgi:hypothetical protein